MFRKPFEGRDFILQYSELSLFMTVYEMEFTQTVSGNHRLVLL